MKKFNPVEKNIDIYLYGIPENIINNIDYLDKTMQNSIKLSKATLRKKIVEASYPGASGVYLLLESEAAWHSTPETEPNFMSFKISTCGSNTHPIYCLRYVLERINPASGKVCYYKEGLDLINRSIFPKTIDRLIEKYTEQFGISKYCFEFQEIRQFEYDFFFYEPSRLTEKMASILGIELPLSEETKKPGMRSR